MGLLPPQAGCLKTGYNSNLSCLKHFLVEGTIGDDHERCISLHRVYGGSHPLGRCAACVFSRPRGCPDQCRDSGPTFAEAASLCEASKPPVRQPWCRRLFSCTCTSRRSRYDDEGNASAPVIEFVKASQMDLTGPRRGPRAPRSLRAPLFGVCRLRYVVVNYGRVDRANGKCRL